MNTEETSSEFLTSLDVLRQETEDLLQDITRQQHRMAPISRIFQEELTACRINLHLQTESLRREHDKQKELYQKYQKLYDFAPVGYLALDEYGTIYNPNATLTEMLMVEKEQLNRHLLYKFVSWKDRDTLFLHLRQLKRYQSEKSSELTLRNSKGDILYVQMNSERISAGTGKGICISSLTDITKRREAESALKSSRQQLRNYANKLQHVREDERTRLSRHLHDQLGQSLTAVKLELSRLERFFSVEQEDARDALTKLERNLIGIIESVKRISRELRPDILDNLGIEESVKAEVQRFRRRTGIQCHCRVDLDEMRLPGDFKVTLHRILQESLTNISRHADATVTWVELTAKDSIVHLRVMDNGIGMSDPGPGQEDQTLCI